MAFRNFWLFEKLCLLELERYHSDYGIKDEALSHMAKYHDSSHLHLLLDELLTLGGKAALRRRREQQKKAQQEKKHVSVFPTTSQKRNPSMLLPEYGFGKIENLAPGILCISELSAIVRDLQERHGNEGRYKRSKMFTDFLSRASEIPGMPAPDLKYKVLEKCGSPTNEIALLNYNFWRDTTRILLPPDNAVVLTSIATAGSGEEGEWNSWFRLYGKTYTELTYATILDSGVTGRNSHAPTEGALLVKYDQYARKETWAALSERLYNELMEDTEKQGIKFKCADWIFHWGCISHYETRILGTNKTVEGWGRHEHWNMLMCIAMARHALECLKKGGNLVLKVRMFQETETLGLVAVLSCLFGVVRLYPNYRMQAELVGVVCEGFIGNDGVGKKNDIVTLVKKILKASTSYKVFDIFDARIVGNAKFQTTLKRAYEVREEMRRDHDRVTYVMMHIMYLISEDIQFNDIDLNDKLIALEQDLPFEIDATWRSGIIKQVKYLQVEIKRPERQNDCTKLRNFVKDFVLEKFK